MKHHGSTPRKPPQPRKRKRLPRLTLWHGALVDGRGNFYTPAHALELYQLGMIDARSEEVKKALGVM